MGSVAPHAAHNFARSTKSNHTRVAQCRTASFGGTGLRPVRTARMAAPPEATLPVRWTNVVRSDLARSDTADSDAGAVFCIRDKSLLGRNSLFHSSSTGLPYKLSLRRARESSFRLGGTANRCAFRYTKEREGVLCRYPYCRWSNNVCSVVWG